MHVIIDYGMGNLHSLKNALDRIDFETVISSDIDVIKNADSLILPGVGAFGMAMDNLRELGLVDIIKEQVKNGKYLLGICLGMQLLFEKSFEYGEHEGLGLIDGTVKYMDIDLKVPHMGWNALKFETNDDILKYIKEENYVYYVHSYYADKCNDIIAYSDYEKKIPGIVRNGNVIGMQFHPEKSANVGRDLLMAYKEMVQ